MSSRTDSADGAPNLTLDPVTGAIRMIWTPDIRYHPFEHGSNQTRVLGLRTASARKAMRLHPIPLIDRAYHRIRTTRPSIGRGTSPNYT
jgi:hypothetical protein